MMARILRPEEWSKLESHGAPGTLPFVEPQNIAVVVVEGDSGEIMASVQALRVTHFEGLWIAPEHRGNAGVFRSLIRQAYAVPQARDERWAIGAAANGDGRMDVLCNRLGGKPLPMHLFAIPVAGA